MYAIVTDSSSQLPAELIERYDIVVVPISVTVDGVEYLEGVDLDADGFYELWADGVPEVSTSQPSPGAFIEAYERAVAAGASEILSVHVGSAFSGTINSARLAAAEVGVPVRAVDTNTVSFGISCCVWEAAEARAQGYELEHAAARAEAIAPSIGSVTVLQGLEVARKMGRLPEGLAPTAEGVPVFKMVDRTTEVIGHGSSVESLSTLMVDAMTEGDEPIRAALCIADASARPFYESMEAHLSDRPNVVEIVRYRLGPSVGAFTGPGAAGGFWYPVAEPPGRA